jgi:hypothetical protein
MDPRQSGFNRELYIARQRNIHRQIFQEVEKRNLAFGSGIFRFEDGC